MAIEIIPSSAPVGAEIRGVDLASDIDDATLRQIRDALNLYAMIFFRHQHGLSPQKQIEFTKRFGPLQDRPAEAHHRLREYPDILIVSNILENGRPIGLIEAG